MLAEFLTDLWAQTGLAAGDTLLVGFSQGAMMALYVGLGLNPSPMGIIAFSGALVAPDSLLERAGPKPPVCLVHGDRHPVVDPQSSTDALARLERHGFPERLHVDAGSGHMITEEGLRFAGRFIAEIAGKTS